MLDPSKFLKWWGKRMSEENETQGDAGMFDPAEAIVQAPEVIAEHVKRAVEHLITYGEGKVADTVKFLHTEYAKRAGK